MNIRDLSPGKILNHYRVGFQARFKNQNEMPLVSVVVPLFNEEKFIKECLQSLQNQNYKNLEVIIVNDASTDRSREIAEGFCKKSSSWTLLDHSVNKGLPGTRNTGLKRAKGKYVTFLDADDYLFSDSIMRRVLALEETVDDPRIFGVVCRILEGPEEGGSLAELASKFVPATDEVYGFYNLTGVPPFRVHAPLVKTEEIRKFGGFPEELVEGAEDLTLWFKVMRNGYLFQSVPFFGGVYRQKRSGMLRTLAKEHCEVITGLIRSLYLPSPKTNQVRGTPTYFDKSVGEYFRLYAESKRVLLFAVQVYLQGDRASFRELLDCWKDWERDFVRDYGDLRGAIDFGIRRFHCLSPSALSRKRKKYESLRSDLYQAIRTELEGYKNARTLSMTPSSSLSLSE